MTRDEAFALALAKYRICASSDAVSGMLASLAASGFAVVPLIDKFKLQALENGGVDNWDWYGDAMEEAENMLAAAQEDSHD